MNKLFLNNIPVTTIEINTFEKIEIFGDYDNFDFKWFIFSEVTQSWLKQDTKELELFYKSSYDDLLKKIQNKLVQEGKFHEQYSAI